MTICYSFCKVFCNIFLLNLSFCFICKWYNVIMNFIFIMFASMFGGFIQTITGFGSGIVIMLFLPYIFSVMKASALNNMITIILNFILVKRFCKYIDLVGAPKRLHAATFPASRRRHTQS